MVTSNVAWLPIQSKQQGNKKRLGLEVGSDRGGGGGGGGVGPNLRKQSRQYRWRLRTIGAQESSVNYGINIIKYM